jgi:photosystem II stability/assembly factor-like uncharacterized protein
MELQMPFAPMISTTRTVLLSGVTATLLAVAACTPPASPTPPGTTGAGNTVPGAHVHGLTVSGETGQILLATHEGLFDVTSLPATQIGDTHDLMGFTASPADGVYYASGHPGHGSDLPNPLGLLRSSDGGKSWEILSRQGESDFHAMTTTQSGILAFDGALQASADGRSWKTIAADFVPAVLAGHPNSSTVLATTPEGIQRSTDAGATWKPVKDGPVIQFATFAHPTGAVGVGPGGTVYYSADAGETWTKKGRIDAQVAAIASTVDAEGRPRIWAATPSGIIVSTDGGATFRPA